MLFSHLSFQSLRRDAYDHFTAIYYLLNERLKLHRYSFSSDGRVDSRSRRPSSVAEHAIVRNQMLPQQCVVQQQCGGNVPIVQSSPQTSSPILGFRPVQPAQQQTPVADPIQAVIQRKHSETLMSPQTDPLVSPHNSCVFNEGDVVTVPQTIGGTLLDPLQRMSLHKMRSVSPNHMVVTSIDEGVEADLPESESEYEKTPTDYLPSRGHTIEESFEIPTMEPSLSDFGIEPQDLSSSFDSQEEMEIAQSFAQSSMDSPSSVESPTGVTSHSACNSPDITAAAQHEHLLSGRQMVPFTQTPFAIERSSSQSPVSFREGRRASDGLLAHGSPAFRPNKNNSRAVGVAELRLEQQNTVDVSRPISRPKRLPLHQTSFTGPTMLTHVSSSSDVVAYNPAACQVTQPIGAEEDATWRRFPLQVQSISRQNRLLAMRQTRHTEPSVSPRHTGIVGQSSFDEVARGSPNVSNARSLQQHLMHQRLMQKRQQLQKQSQLSQQFQRMHLERQASFEGRPPPPTRADSYKQAQQHPVLPQYALSGEESPVQSLTPHETFTQGSPSHGNPSDGRSQHEVYCEHSLSQQSFENTQFETMEMDTSDGAAVQQQTGFTYSQC